MSQTATPTRVPAARPPKPLREGLFKEPEYSDGPYDRGDEDDDLEDLATITP